ncbi:MAG: hypothetical protein OS130_14965 [Thermodesulfobacteriota bacterium]|jgi:hypothetical protein|nr:MAG: hypothetical protein OS130_14965 [Thermodesulfobacteriota bacterium]
MVERLDLIQAMEDELFPRFGSTMNSLKFRDCSKNHRKTYQRHL